MTDHTDDVLQRTLSHAEMPESLAFRPNRLEDIKRRARRRTNTRLLGGLASVAAVALLATTAASNLVIPSQTLPTGASSEEATSAVSSPQPAPWSDTPVAEDSEGVVFSVPGTAYLAERGSIGDASWVAASGKVSDPPYSCVFVKGDDLFATMQADCFDSWDGEERARWSAFRSDRAEQATIFVGAVDTTARQVVVTFDDGSREVIDAVATPTSTTLRFFAFSRSEAGAVRTVMPVAADGGPAAPPPASETAPCDSDCPTPVP